MSSEVDHSCTCKLEEHLPCVTPELSLDHLILHERIETRETLTARLINMVDEKTPLEPPPAYDGDIPNNNASSAPRRPRMPLPLDLPALQMLRGKRVILASASPRRRQLLAQVHENSNLSFNFRKSKIL